jgi:hypothetical protein
MPSPSAEASGLRSQQVFRGELSKVAWLLPKPASVTSEAIPMTYRMAEAPVRPVDRQDSEFLPASLALLLATARQEIDAHIDDDGLCAACGSAYPCERAVLAELALGGL